MFGKWIQRHYDCSVNSIEFQGQAHCPSKIVCVGRNYVDHIAELGNEVPDSMVIFMKPNSAINSALFAGNTESHHYEAELCFLVEKGAFAGIGFGIDLTRRKLQSRLKEKGLPWERSKAFDGSAVFSEFVPVPPTESRVSFSLEINQRIVQQADASLMIHSPATILEEIGSFMSLEDGDIVMTGTPKGVGVIQSGDQFTGRVHVDEREVIVENWVAQ